MGATQILSEYIAKVKFSDLPPEVVLKAKGIVLDTLGCAIAGYTLASHEFHWIYDLAKEMGGNPESTVWLAGMKTSCPQAALVNGTLIHTVDFDDTHMGSIAHLGAPVVSSVLAMGEKTGADGPSVLTALVLAYEVAGRIGKAIMPSHYKYWHPTGTLGTIASAVVASKLMNLPPDRTEQALGLAADGASGLRYCIDFGDFSKSLHPGFSAWKGILSALVIGKGATGPKGLLEYKSGFCEAYSDEPAMKHLTENLGSSYEVLADSLKAFPTILCSHTPIQGTVQLMKAKNLRLEDVDAIHFRVSPTAPGQGMNYSPDSALSARLSIPYCVSRAAADGYVAMDQFQDEKIKEPRVQAFMKKVTLESVPSFNEKYPGTLAAELEIKTKDGKRYQAESIYPKGHPRNSMTEEEIKEKFRRLALNTLDRAQIDRIVETVFRLDKLKSVGELVPALMK
jgi:2-methylcitrate dehydratase PrpD